VKKRAQEVSRYVLPIAITWGGETTTPLFMQLALARVRRGRNVGHLTDAFALPIVRALDEGRPNKNPYDTASVRVICSAGVAWSAHIKERLLEHMPHVTLLDACGALPDQVEYVPDRRANDLRYSMTCDKVTALGWAPQRPFAEGLAQTVEWYRDNPGRWAPLLRNRQARLPRISLAAGAAS